MEISKIVVAFSAVLAVLLSPEAVAKSAAWSPNVAAQEIGWPLELAAPDGNVVIYQPQAETFKGDAITGRAAVSLTQKGQAAPVFGAAWFQARVMIDRDSRTAQVVDATVTKAVFPNSPPDQEKRFSDFVAGKLAGMNLPISLDRLRASLEIADRETANVADLRNDPPKILFATTPTVLVTLDGAPEMRPLENSKVMRVVNTPFAIVFNPAGKIYYLRAGDVWASAPDIGGPWLTAASLPDDVRTALPADMLQSTGSPSAVQPEIIVATEPTELIVTDGAPKYTPLPGNDLLYISNTESDVFLDIESGRYFVLLAGRWFSAPQLDAPWTFVPAKELPIAFCQIPPGSTKGGVLAQVPGTEQAEAAVMEANIPQTQAIRRDAPVDLQVGYDGDPKLEKIEGTALEYATNTPLSIIKSEAKFYCCKDAVWYEAAAASGPWIICAAPAPAIYTIPPSSPVYNVTYVRVYTVRPDVIYFGYTSGYTGSYICGGTLVYGTGYRYRAWVGGVYFPRPATWGFGVRYNPYTNSWGFGVRIGGAGGWYGSALRWGGSVSPYSGWWGPSGYRNYGDIYGNKLEINRSTNVNVSNQWGGGNNYSSINNNFNNIGNNNGNNNNSGIISNRPQPPANPPPNNGGRPSLPPAGNGDRPGRPGQGDRPGGGLPGNGNGASTLPADNGDRPGRPGQGNRPGGGLPGNGNQPSTLPADNGAWPGRPGQGNRPGGNLPGNGNQPSTLPADNGAWPGRPGPGNRPGDRLPNNNGQRPAQLPAGGIDNIYNRPVNRPIEGPVTKEARPGQPAVRPAQLPNNVFADRSGDVFRKNGDAWQARDNNTWKNAQGGKQPAPKPQPNQPAAKQPNVDRGPSNFDRARPQLERDNQARARGASQPKPQQPKPQQPKPQQPKPQQPKPQQPKPQQPKPQQPKAQPRPQPGGAAPAQGQKANPRTGGGGLPKQRGL